MTFNDLNWLVKQGLAEVCAETSPKGKRKEKLRGCGRERGESAKEKLKKTPDRGSVRVRV